MILANNLDKLNKNQLWLLLADAIVRKETGTDIETYQHQQQTFIDAIQREIERRNKTSK